MRKQRSYNFSLTLMGSLALPEKDVAYFIRTGNEALEKKTSGHQLIAAATGGAPVDESNIDKVFELAIRSGFRKAFRNKELDEFKDLTGISVKVDCTPKGKSISEGRNDE